MHYISIQSNEYGTIHLNHNDDFSGNVSIVWGKDENKKEVIIPGKILLLLNREVIRRELIDKAINWFEMDMPDFD